MVIIATVVAMALGFVALVFLDNGSSSNSAEDASLDLNQNEDINKLISDYFTAKKTVDVEAMSTLVSDPNRIPKERYMVMAGYVEDYKDFDCYAIQNEESEAYRVYVKYYMKLKNIESWVPCLTTYYIKKTSDERYVLYFSALDEVEEEFINSADKNMEIVKLKDEVKKGLNEVLEKDGAFKQFYQKMEKEIAAASASEQPAATGQATATPTPTVAAATAAPAQ